jgi:hypothetical protein
MLDQRDPLHEATPAAQHGIRNFAWLRPGVLARGEQPHPLAPTLAALQTVGIGAILCLREATEPGRRDWPDYAVAEEAAACAALGLHFHHVACQDFAAPPPEAVAAALRAIDAEAAAARPLYVHCLAGVGRTGIVTAAWLMTQGSGGDTAAALYWRFVEHITARRWQETPAAPLREHMGLPAQMWALQEIARALGTTVAPRPDWSAAAQPAGTDDWPARYWAALAPWRERGRAHVRADGRR